MRRAGKYFYMKEKKMILCRKFWVWEEGRKDKYAKISKRKQNVLTMCLMSVLSAAFSQLSLEPR